jgi:hypothetical protein
MTTTPTASDWLKYIRAQAGATLDYVADWIAGSAQLTDDADPLCEALDSVRALIDEAPLDDPDHYSDGRRVWTELDDPRFPLVYVWHPDPANKRNQPQTFGGAAWDYDGRRRTVIVSAPGVLDVITVEPLRAVE